MREILFRGKFAMTGIWMEGNIYQHGEQCFIMANDRNYEAIPETVGQFIGMTDKNGKKIFEGDIVRHDETLYEIRYIEKYTRFAGVRPGTVFAAIPYVRCEVIGNIHDDPKLLT